MKLGRTTIAELEEAIDDYSPKVEDVCLGVNICLLRDLLEAVELLEKLSACSSSQSLKDKAWTLLEKLK